MTPAQHLTLRLDPDLLEQLNHLATDLGWSRTAAINVLLRAGLRSIAVARAEVQRPLEELVIALASGPPPESPDHPANPETR